MAAKLFAISTVNFPVASLRVDKDKDYLVLRTPVFFCFFLCFDDTSAEANVVEALKQSRLKYNSIH